MLNQLFSQMGANTKSTIGVSVSPSIGLEMIEINAKTKVIEKYACKPLDYDSSKREIADYETFKAVLNDLFDELKINKKCNIILTLPAVHYDLISLPSSLSDEAITSAIVSEVEQSSYIFKRQDPVVSWVLSSQSDKDNKTLLYGAVQQSALDEINNACNEVGCTLIAVETAPHSLLKTLSYNQLAEEQMSPNTNWNLMVINTNSYYMITLNGRNITEFREEPLALRSFVGDEIYDAIMSSAQATLRTTSANYLYIVSETDLVSAEVLSMKIPFDGNIKFLENNKYVQNPIMQASYNILPNAILKITPEAIGSGIYQVTDYPIKFNLLGQGTTVDMVSTGEAPRIQIGNTEIELSSAFVKKMALIIGVIILVPALLLFLVLNTLSSKKQTELDDINRQIETTKEELKNFDNVEEKKTDFNAGEKVNEIQKLNRTKLIFFSAIGENLPQNAWLIYFKINDRSEVDIIGRAKTAEDVYAFFKGLKMSVIDSNLRLNKLEMSADSIGNLVIQDINSMKPTFYEFEITNMSENAIRKMEDLLNMGSKDKEGREKDGKEGSQKRRRGFLFEDFLQIPQVEGKDATEQHFDQGDPPKDLPANLETIENF